MSGVILNNVAYDVLKKIATIILPALGTLYFALCQIWGFPFGEEVIGTIAAVDTFLGAILGISTSNYNNVVQANAEAPELEDNYFEGDGDE